VEGLRTAAILLTGGEGVLDAVHKAKAANKWEWLGEQGKLFKIPEEQM
jgi:hypothetical protein